MRYIISLVICIILITIWIQVLKKGLVTNGSLDDTDTNGMANKREERILLASLFIFPILGFFLLDAIIHLITMFFA